MTQKHFKAIAVTFRRHLISAEYFELDDDAKDAIASLAREQAKYFASVNPNFRKGMFFLACGLTEEGTRD